MLITLESMLQRQIHRLLREIFLYKNYIEYLYSSIYMSWKTSRTRRVLRKPGFYYWHLYNKALIAVSVYSIKTRNEFFLNSNLWNPLELIKNSFLLFIITFQNSYIQHAAPKSRTLLARIKRN